MLGLPGLQHLGQVQEGEAGGEGAAYDPVAAGRAMAQRQTRDPDLEKLALR